MITERDAREWSAPNSVPAGPDAGTTVVSCDADDRSVGEIYVSVNYARSSGLCATVTVTVMRNKG
jgi:hypothetical protein